MLIAFTTIHLKSGEKKNTEDLQLAFSSKKKGSLDMDALLESLYREQTWCTGLFTFDNFLAEAPK